MAQLSIGWIIRDRVDLGAALSVSEVYIESERKFLLEFFPEEARLCAPTFIRQAYLVNNEEVELRIRISESAEDAGALPTLTVKSGGARRDRAEEEFALKSVQLADELLESSSLVVVKKRYGLLTDVPGNPGHSYAWEIDVFEGANDGLSLVELELGDYPLPAVFPDWVGREVTGDKRYYNRNLAQHPFGEWRID